MFCPTAPSSVTLEHVSRSNRETIISPVEKQPLPVKFMFAAVASNNRVLYVSSPWETPCDFGLGGGLRSASALKFLRRWFAELPTRELYHATLGCLQLGTYQQLNLSCANDSLIYVTDVSHGRSNQSQVTCTPDMTSSLSDDSWCSDGPPYNEMVITECNSRTNCTVDTAEMSSAMYTCHEHVTDVFQATYRCLTGIP